MNLKTYPNTMFKNNTIINYIVKSIRKQNLLDELKIHERHLINLQLTNDHSNWTNKTLLHEIGCQIRLIRRINTLLKVKYNCNIY